jgi:hypothetical protein
MYPRPYRIWFAGDDPEYVRRYLEQLGKVLKTFPGRFQVIQDEDQDQDGYTVYRIWSDTRFWTAFLDRGLLCPKRRAEERIEFYDRPPES